MNPQFTCRSCPCASELDTHEAVDDLGQAFHMVDAVHCSHDGSSRDLSCLWLEFPNPLGGVVEGVPPRVEPGVACPLLVDPERFALRSVVVEGVRWAPEGSCATCQFYRGTRGNRTPSAAGREAGIAVECAAPATSAEC